MADDELVPHPGRRFVLVLEYRLPEEASSDAFGEIGRVAAERLVNEELLEGARFVAAWAAKGPTAFQVIELMPPRPGVRHDGESRRTE